ncbi:hypothetical protein NDU88_005855 [Pleurodeles waltl]|uniref:Uncharacterized protein n=1 Tax=Pleurodeles waltl TaxID=8319 RepID=A0AAV7VPE6_PLEWA|nr:hypothetical protein NDU88_005855 [Pleurodeles waltl]
MASESREGCGQPDPNPTAVVREAVRGEEHGGTHRAAEMEQGSLGTNALSLLQHHGLPKIVGRKNLDYY